LTNAPFFPTIPYRNHYLYKPESRATGWKRAILVTESIKPFYVNKKNQRIELEVSFHARQRFVQRWRKLYGETLSFAQVDAYIAQYFPSAIRITNFSQHERNRLRRYGKDTLFFRTSGLTFVVQNSTIITVEISDKGMRYLNVDKPLF
jgi:hypothetical protein